MRRGAARELSCWHVGRGIYVYVRTEYSVHVKPRSVSHRAVSAPLVMKPVRELGRWRAPSSASPCSGKSHGGAVAEIVRCADGARALSDCVLAECCGAASA